MKDGRLVPLVYCDHCKWYKYSGEDSFGGMYHECRYIANTKIKRDYRHEYKTYEIEPSTTNKNNDCGWFFPKWHKKRRYRGCRT